jgi:hypothetical protein
MGSKIEGIGASFRDRRSLPVGSGSVIIGFREAPVLCRRCACMHFPMTLQTGSSFALASLTWRGTVHSTVTCAADLITRAERLSQWFAVQ